MVKENKMNCPVCHNSTKVIDTRSAGFCVKRRRKCVACGCRFTTEEWLVMPPHSKKALTEIRNDYMDL